MEDVYSKTDKQSCFDDLYSGIIPKRVPISAAMSLELVIQNAGLDLAKTQWTLEGVDEAIGKMLPYCPSDTYPIGFIKPPLFLEILKSKSFKMSKSGFIQHPEVAGMEAEEYDEYIKNPWDFTMEKTLPRLFPALDTDPVTRINVWAKAVKANTDANNIMGAIMMKYFKQYGFYQSPPGTISSFRVPIDGIADFKRGFTGTMTDIHRCPDKVLAACDALLPFMVHRAIPAVKSKLGYAVSALHMGPFMNLKQFEKFYWPGMEKVINIMGEAGQRSSIFCEHNWMPFLDYLYDLPAGQVLYFEYGDPKIIKEKLGKKHIIAGLYPITLIKTGTKQQCIDKAKELIDILAPGGNYYFNFDKGPLMLGDINIDNYLATLEYVRDNTRYDNAGQKSTTYEHCEGAKHYDVPKFESKYYITWDKFKADHPEIDPRFEDIIKPQVQATEEMLFSLVNMYT